MRHDVPIMYATRSRPVAITTSMLPHRLRVQCRTDVCVRDLKQEPRYADLFQLFAALLLARSTQIAFLKAGGASKGAMLVRVTRYWVALERLDYERGIP